MSATCWALLVVSSEGQRENLNDYVVMAREDAVKHGWVLERLEDYREIASGKAGVREPVLKMLADLKAMPPARRPQWIWCRRTDRFSRGPASEATMVKVTILSLGVGIWDHDRGEIKIGNAQEELIENVAGFYARFDNEIRSSKVRAKYDERRKTGAPAISNKRPYGLRVVAGGQLEVIPEEAQIVRQIFEMRIAGLGGTVIGNAVRPIAPPRFRKDGKPWKKRARFEVFTITRILRNRKYSGTIVDEVTWQRAQIRPEHTNRHWNMTPVHEWPLTGAIRCFCNGPMSGNTSGSGPGVRRYYRCSRGYTHRGAPYASRRANELEAEFLAVLRLLEDDPGAVHRASTQLSVELIERALRTAKAELGEVSLQRGQAFSLNAAGHLRDEDLQERLDSLKGALIEIEQRVADLQQQRAVALASQTEGHLVEQMISEAIACWRSPAAEAKDKRMLAIALAKLVGGFYVDPEGRLQIGEPPIALRLHG